MNFDFDSISLICDVCLLISIIVLTIGAVLIFRLVHDSKAKHIWFCAVIAVSLMLSPILIVCIGEQVIYSKTNAINEYIKEEYNLTINEKLSYLDISEIKTRGVSKELIAKVDGSSRVYGVYLVEKDGKLVLHTKNDKGLYLPVTPMSSKDITNYK